MSDSKSYFASRLKRLSAWWHHHGLRGSASPVLTATVFVSWRGQYLTPTESTPINRSPKNLLLVITSPTPTAVPDLVQIRVASGRMGEIWRKFIYVGLYIYLYLFTWTHLQVKPVDGFSRLMTKTTRTLARIFLQLLDRFWLNLARWCMLVHSAWSKVQIFNFRQYYMAGRRHLAKML